MSWQDYVNVNMLGSKKVAKAAIYGQDESLWATSPGFAPEPNEISDLLKVFKDPTKPAFYLEKQKYQILRRDEDRSLYAKLGTGGAVVVKTKKAILIGLYSEGVQPGDCNLVVENLADYLISVNY